MQIDSTWQKFSNLLKESRIFFTDVGTADHISLFICSEISLIDYSHICLFASVFSLQFNASVEEETRKLQSALKVSFALLSYSCCYCCCLWIVALFTSMTM